jgi:hypothetical protein
MGLTAASFKLLPLKDRLQKGARLVRDMVVLFGLPADLKENGGTFEYLLASQPSTTGCALLLGFLQEAFAWIAAGRILQVEENGCVCEGRHVCTIRVALYPI